MDIRDEIDNLLSKYSTLSYNEKEGYLEGEVFIDDFDSYNVKILLGEYPVRFPVVFETDERIPRKVYRHIYSNSGSCCFTTQAKAQILLKTKIRSLTCFVKEILIPYFQNNSYYEINGCYQTEEYSHDKSGVIEGYIDILKTDKLSSIAELIYGRINGEKLSIRNECYCGSGVKLKKCNHGKHDICYREFRMIDILTLKADFITFYNYLKLSS